MNQKGFANIVLILVTVILVGAVGYFAFVKKPKPVAQQPTPTPTQTETLTSTPPTSTQPSTTGTGQKPSTSDIAGYPYILKPLSQTQLSVLRSEFEALNKNICAQINEYGFTKFKSGCFGESAGSGISNATAGEMVKNWLVKNSKFTGITREADVVVGSGDGIGCMNCANDTADKPTPISERKYSILKFQLPDQVYNGLLVEGDVSPIVVFVNANGISRIDGFWFPKITVPLEPKVSEASTKNKLNGRIFTYGDIAGRPVNYRVEQKDLSNVAHKVVFVKKSSQGLEFRLAWKISVGQGLSWTVYIDAVTGEELKVVQMFQT